MHDHYCPSAHTRWLNSVPVPADQRLIVTSETELGVRVTKALYDENAYTFFMWPA